MNKLTNILAIAAFSLSAIFALACGAEQSEQAKKETSQSENPNNTTKITVSKRGYEPKSIAAKKGQPIKLVFFREDGDNCGDELVFPKLNVKKNLAVGATEVVEFTPQETGEIGFTCGMDMLRGKVIVSD